MPLRRFIPYDVVGAGLWGTTFVVLGYIFWHSFDQVAEIAKKGALALGFVIALAFGIYAAVKWLRVDENRHRAMQWIESQPLLRPLLPVARRVKRPLVFAWNRLTPGELGLELTTLLMAGGVGFFVFFGYWHIFTVRRTTVGDMRAINVADDLNIGTGVAIAKVVTALGALPITGGLVLAASLLLLARRRAAEALALAAGMGLTVWAVHWAKDAVDRQRPHLGGRDAGRPDHVADRRVRVEAQPPRARRPVPRRQQERQRRVDPDGDVHRYPATTRRLSSDGSSRSIPAATPLVRSSTSSSMPTLLPATGERKYLST